MDAVVYGEPPLEYTISDETLREELVDPDAARRWVAAHPDDVMTTPVLRILGDLDAARDRGAARMTRLDPGSPRWAAAAMRLAHVHHWRGEYDEADRLLDEAGTAFAASGDTGMTAFVHQHRAKARFDEGRYAEALHEARTAFSLREERAAVEDPGLLASARQTLTRIATAAQP